MIGPLPIARPAAVATLLSLTLAGTAGAADQTILGRQFVVIDPGTPDRRKVTVKAKEYQSDDSIVGAPVADGATLTVTALGATSTIQTFDLPAGTSPATGRAFWTGDVVKGFTYRDRRGENGAVKVLQIKRQRELFQIRVAVSGRLGALSVVPPNPGTGGCVLIALTSGDSYSVSFATGDGQIRNGGATYFKVTKPLSQGSCVSTTSTTTSTTSTSMTLPVPCGDTIFPTCGGTCPGGSTCEGVFESANSDFPPSFCGGTFCLNPGTQYCACVPVGSVCTGACDGSFCPITYTLSPGECGPGRHCAIVADYFCFSAGLTCTSGCRAD